MATDGDEGTKGSAGDVSPRVRLVVVVVLAALLLASAWWIWQARPTGGSGAAGDYEVAVVAPGGTVFWNGTVTLGEGANALAALEAAALAGNFTVGVERSALGTYVVRIGEHAETADLGWTYYIADEEGVDCPGAAADVWLLDPGDRVAWRWAVPGGTC